jgi:hypothetical protein
MFYSERFVLDPFTNRIFTKLDVTGRFGSHIMGPLDAGVVVVVEKSRLCCVRKRMASLAHASAEMAKGNDLFRSCVCGSYFSFARAERRALLAFTEPSKRSAVAKNDATAHTPKFEKGKKGSVRNGISNLRSPTSIAV